MENTIMGLGFRGLGLEGMEKIDTTITKGHKRGLCLCMAFSEGVLGSF